jgi:hypothetical protein
MVDDQDVDKHITISSMCHEAAGKYIVDGENLVRRTTSPRCGTVTTYVWAVVVSKFIGASGREIHMRAAAM